MNTEEKNSPQTTEELYNMLLETPDLAGKLELEGDAVFWTFNNFWVYASLDQNEGYIEVNIKKEHWWQSSQLLHWHPMKDEIYKDLCALGNKNNVLVIRSGWLFSDIFYLGKESEYKYTPNKKRHRGRLYYLKPQD